MVMNAILRVDRIFPRGKTPMLAGRLIYRDTTCTFEAPVTWFRHRAATYLAKLLLTRECALLFTKHRWSKRLFEIATLFHSPEQGLAVAQPLPSGSENDSEGAGFTV
jgi:hypothetical protein